MSNNYVRVKSDDDGKVVTNSSSCSNAQVLLTPSNNELQANGRECGECILTNDGQMLSATNGLIIDDCTSETNTVPGPNPENGNVECTKIQPLDTKNLPETVTVLTTPSGSILYLTGTAHFSSESQDDVSKVIQAVQPDKVIVELCPARLRILLHDENSLLEEAKNLNFQTFRAILQQNGFFNGVIYILMLNMNAQITKDLGMAPGGEFRRAFVEARRVPNCVVGLGDRPINITIQRALRSLSWWQTVKLSWNLLTSSDSITKEEVERCKRRDFLEEIMAELGTTFPVLEQVFVKERDIFLTHALQLACEPMKTRRGTVPMRVVGIVGIGHVNGIKENWGKVEKSQIPPILSIPPTSWSSKVITFTMKASLFGAVTYACYKILPCSMVIKSVKSSVTGLLKIGKK